MQNNDRKPLVIFLDFDGVLHPYFCEKEDKFKYNKNLSFVLNMLSKDYNVKIVISSSWKNRHQLDEIKALFPNDIASLIDSATPNLEVMDGSRLKEAFQWMEQNNYDGAWIALDDDHYAWNKHENLIHCMDRFQEEEMALMTKKLGV